MVEREWRTLDVAAKNVWRVKGIIIFGMMWIFLSLATLLGWYYTSPSSPDKEIPPLDFSDWNHRPCFIFHRV